MYRHYYADGIPASPIVMVCSDIVFTHPIFMLTLTWVCVHRLQFHIVYYGRSPSHSKQSLSGDGTAFEDRVFQLFRANIDWHKSVFILRSQHDRISTGRFSSVSSASLPPSGRAQNRNYLWQFIRIMNHMLYIFTIIHDKKKTNQQLGEIKK